MKFSEMAYERPDMTKLKDCILAQAALLKSAKIFQYADTAFLAVDDIQKQVNTAESIASVRHEISTLDTFYEKEVLYFDENLPLLEAVQQSFSKALLESPFRGALEEKYGTIFFTNTEMDMKSFSPEIVPLLQQENILITEYGKLLASAQIPFEGSLYTLSQLAPYKQSSDDDRRLRAWQAEGRFYSENGPDLDRIFGRLVALRHRQAKVLGHENFVPVAYSRMRRGSYDPKQVSDFRKSIVNHIVPLADLIMRKQAERLSVPYPLTYPDADLGFRSGNPRPVGGADGILRTAKSMYHELSPETGEFIDFMYENELMDLLSKKGKGGGGFCTSLPEYKSPFIFANFNGTSGDVEVMTHEAGHAFAYYMGRNQVPQENSQPTLEACEIHSMSMEFLAWPWASEFFAGDAEKFRYAHLSGAITFLPYGAMVDHFQHEVYSNPDIGEQGRHELWRGLLKIYMPWMRLDDLPFYGEGKGWQRQMHIYQSPFYYIDYCLAQTVALELWTLSTENHRSGWEKYLSFTKLSGTMDFMQLIGSAGLASPFDSETLSNVARASESWLNSCNTSSF